MCHTVPPRLNKFGVAYKENGFELPPGTVLPESEVYGNQVLSNDEPKAIVGAGFPFMIRTGLTVDLTGSTTLGGATTGNNAFLGAALGEFGMIGGGSMETAIGGLGFWIDAPFAGAAAGGGVTVPVIANGTASGAVAIPAFGPGIGALDLDFNFSPMAKVSVGNDAPKVGYALGLTPIYVGANSRNPATVAAPAGGTFIWGNGGTPAISVRGTTNPSTGLGLNYIVGYIIPGAAVLPAPAAPGTAANSGFFGHVSYFIDAINSNIGLGYSTQTPGTATAGVADGAATSMLVDFAYGVGDNLLVTLTYNQTTDSALGGVAVTTGADKNTYLCLQPEFAISPSLSVGGRYATATNGAAGAPSATTISVGANYKLLQNILAWTNYTSVNNNAAGAAAATSSLMQAGIDFIF
jgi:hypothetical protein